MVGLIQLLIYLVSACLIYKGIEIFQIAFVSNEKNRRFGGMILGIILTIIAVMAAGAAFFASTMIANDMGNKLNNIPSLH